MDAPSRSLSPIGFTSGSLANWESDDIKSEPYSPSSSELHVHHSILSPSAGLPGTHYDHLFSCAMDIIPLPCYKCAASLATVGPEQILRLSCEEREMALLEYQAAQVAIQQCTALLNYYRLRLNTLKSHAGQYAGNAQQYHEEKNLCLRQVENRERELYACRETCARTKAALRRADRVLVMAQRFCQIVQEPRESHSLLLSDATSSAAASPRTALRRW